MKRIGRAIVIPAAVLALFVPLCYAASEQDYDLGQIVVTPTRDARSVRDLSVSTSVLTAEEIEATNANTLTDALNVLPGVFVLKTGQFGRSDIAIRGQGSRGRRIMVLVDGKPEKMGLYGCTITNALPVDNVSRVEVLRGPGSVLYGSDALGGVINVITEKPATPSQGSATVSYGSFDTQEYLLKQGGKLDRFDYFLTFDKAQSRGHLPNSDYRHQAYTGRLGYRLTDGLSASFSSRYFDGFKREPSPATAGTWNDYQRGAYDFTVDGHSDALSGMLKFYRDFGTHKFSDNTHSKDYTNGTLLHGSAAVFDGNTISAGMEFRQQGGKVLNGGGTRGKYEKDEQAVYVHDEQILFDKLIINSGLRYNHDELAGSGTSGEAGAVYHLFDTTSLRANVSKGFRSPQLNELRFSPQANPDLKPEVSWNYETGFNQKLGDKANVDFVYFITRADNFIRVSAGRFRNLDEVNFHGHETTLEYLFNQHLTSRLSYSHLHTGIYSQGRPQDEVDLSLHYRTNRLRASLAGQWVDNYFAADYQRSAIPNFVLLNSKLTYTMSRDWEVFFGIDNLLNSEHKLYVDVPGSEGGVYTQPGRSFTVGSTYSW